MGDLTKKQINAIKQQAVNEFINTILFGYKSGLIELKSIKLETLQKTAEYYNQTLQDETT